VLHSHGCTSILGIYHQILRCTTRTTKGQIAKGRSYATRARRPRRWREPGASPIRPQARSNPSAPPPACAPRGVSGMKIELVRRLRRSTDRYNLLAIYTAPPIGSSRRTFLIALTASKVRRGVRRSSSPRSGTPYRSGARDRTESRCMTMQSPVIRPEPCSP
jgi:hypothetical protein